MAARFFKNCRAARFAREYEANNITGNPMNIHWLHIILLVVLTGYGRLAAASRASEPEDIFQSTNLLHISIEISPAGMDALRSYHWRGDNLSHKYRPKVEARILEGDHIYTNVLVQQKGAGTFRAIDSLPSLTLNFSKQAPKQQFHGLHKLSLNNSIQDPTCLNEKLSRELFAAAKVPVPRADQALVTLNGRRLGIYVLVEGYDKHFLDRHFAQTGGNLYDGGFLRDVTEPLEVNSGRNPADHSDLDRLITATREPDPDRRFQALEKALDVDRFISMTAMETILCHWDSYSINRSNYRVFHDTSSDKMVFMPHGMDRVLGGFLPNLDMAIVPPMQGMVARALISTPEGRRLHIEKVGLLLTNLFDPEKLCKRIREMDKKFASEMTALETRWTIRPQNPDWEVETTGSHERDIENLASRICARAKNLRKQLAASRATLAPAAILTFGPDGIAKVGGWEFRPWEGKPGVISEIMTNDVKRVLHLQIPEGLLVGSVRSRVALPGGRYRLEVKVRAGSPQLLNGQRPSRGIVLLQPGNRQLHILPEWSGIPSPGVMLHYSGNRFGNELHFADLEWANVLYDFRIAPGPSPAEVEFLCDLRRGPGEVWFDLDSSVLVRTGDQ